MLESLLHPFVTLFVTADPISYAPVFITLTQAMDRTAQLRTATIACITAGTLLIIFALVGGPLINFLGISLPAFRIAGGLLLFVIAFDMVFDGRQKRDQGTAQSVGDRGPSTVAIFPLAIPLIAGPGALSATILLSAKDPGWIARLGLIGVIVTLMALSFVVLLLADRILEIIGDVGRVIISRLNGVILAALAVQFVIDGVRVLVHGS